MIDAAALDAIFETAKTTSANQPADGSAPVPTASHANAVINGPVSVLHIQPPDTVIAAHDAASNTADSLSKNTVNGSAVSATQSEFASNELVTLNSHDSHLIAHSHIAMDPDDHLIASFKESIDGGARQTASSMLTETVDTAARHVFGAQDNAIAGASDVQSIAGLVVAGTDTFVFEPTIGNEPVKHLGAPNDVLDLPHHLFANLAELDADLRAAALENSPAQSGDTTTTSHVVSQIQHLHDFHLV